MTKPNRRLPWLATPVMDALAGPGWVVCPQALPEPLVAQLCAWGQTSPLAWHAAGTGRGAAHRAQSVRGDHIHWLDLVQGSAPEQALGAVLEGLRQHLNATLFLNLVDIEAHLARYAPGQGYARHRDRFRGEGGRTISLVLYLNAPDWQAADGGALRIHAEEGLCEVLPVRGTAVLFRSADIEHEVLPATRERRSIAVWFRQPCP